MNGFIRINLICVQKSWLERDGDENRKVRELWGKEMKTRTLDTKFGNYNLPGLRGIKRKEIPDKLIPVFLLLVFNVILFSRR